MEETEYMKIINCLRENSRESITNIAKITNIPTSTVFQKIRDYENSIITKHTSLINFDKSGYKFWFKILVGLGEIFNQDFEKYVKEHENVNSVYEINGGFDYLIETAHKSVKEYNDFVKELQNKFEIIKLDEFQVLNEVKKESMKIKI